METIDFNTVIAENISVVGGLLGLNDTFFNYRGAISDLDLANKNGIYIFSRSTANSPVDGSGKCLSFGDNEYVAQLIITWDTRLLYVRGSIGSEWKKISILA